MEEPPGRVLLNPLLMSKVVKHLTSTSNIDALATLRVTCKLWNNLMDPGLRAQLGECLSPVKFCCCRSTTAQPRRPGYSNLQNLARFVDTMIKTKYALFQSFKLMGISLHEPAVRDFFQMCGPLIVKLSIKFIPTSELSIQEFRILVFTQLPAMQCLTISAERPNGFQTNWESLDMMIYGSPHVVLPNLKEINLETDNLQNQVLAQDFVVELLASAVSLEKISMETSLGDVESNYQDPDSDLEDLAELTDFHMPLILGLQSALPNLSKLRIFDVSDITTNELRNLIQLSEVGRPISRQLQLTKMDIGHFLEPHDEGGALVQLFLEMQANSLETLVVGLNDDYFDHFDEDEDSCTITLPVMPQLKTLKLACCLPIGMQINFTSYVMNFPKLKSLTFKRHLDENDDEEAMLRAPTDWSPCNYYLDISKGPHAGVRTLDISEYDDLDKLFCDPTVLDQFAYLFPNAMKVRIYINDIDHLRHVWNKWPKLEKFAVELCTQDVNQVPTFSVINELVTGITVASQALETDLQAKLEAGVDFQWLETLKAAETPGITDLKQLIEFGLYLCLRLDLTFNFEELKSNLQEDIERSKSWRHPKVHGFNLLRVVVRRDWRTSTAKFEYGDPELGLPR